jgi:hypothetical protein
VFCSLFPRPLPRSRTSSDRPWATTPRRGLEHGHEATQVYAATCTRLIAMIGDLPDCSNRERLSRATTLCR